MISKPILLALGLGLLAATTGTAQAAALECPVVSQVFAQTDKTRGDVSLEKIGRKIGETLSEKREIHPLANTVRTDFPDASDAELADLMIAAYCTYLKTDAPEAQHNQAALTDFEQQAYDAVFNPPAPDKVEDHGWLYGN